MSLEFENKKEIILRDYLALERTRLANDRTLFSYIRTSLYLILAGLAFMQMNDFKAIKWLAPLCFLISAVILILGVASYFKMRIKLKKYYTTPNIPDVDTDL